MRNASYLNTILTIIALLLGLLVLERWTDRADSGQNVPIPGASAPAYGQARVHGPERARTLPGRETDRERPGGLISAAEQRNRILAELKNLSSRVERVETRLSRTLEVKVTEMPPIEIPDRD